MALYLLTEDGGHLLLEDNTGALLLEDPPEVWGGRLDLERADIRHDSYQTERANGLDCGVW